MTVPISYRNIALDTKLRTDLYVENCLVIELKAVGKIQPIFEAQLLTYMKLLKAPKGIPFAFSDL